MEYLHLGDLCPASDRPGRMEPLVDEVVRKTMDEQPVLVVIDSAKALRDFTGERELRMAFYDLTSRLAHTDAALLLLGEYTPDGDGRPGSSSPWPTASSSSPTSLASRSTGAGCGW